MRPESPFSVTVQDDSWLEAQCRAIVQAGKELTRCVAQVNYRLDDAARSRRRREGDVSPAELLIMPVGYANIGKIAAKQYQGIMMGSWMLVTGLASLFAGDFSGMISHTT